MVDVHCLPEHGVKPGVSDAGTMVISDEHISLDDREQHGREEIMRDKPYVDCHGQCQLYVTPLSHERYR